MTQPLRTVGVVGAGSIGATVCVDFVVHGFRVVVVDVSETALAETRELLREVNRFLPAVRPGLTRLGKQEAQDRLVTSTELAALAECEFVVENVSEKWEVKRDLYRELDRILPEGVGIGVNTSSIPIGRLAAETGRAGVIVGIHFMNPSYLKDAVEVMRGDDTSDKCLDHVQELLSLLGKQAVVVGDFPGFVSNRISHLFFNEAIRVVQDQGVEPAVVDDIFKKCFGHTMGPLETADLIGLETVLLTLENLRESYGDDRYHGCALLREMVASGRLGRKSGQGFYHYHGTSSVAITAGV
ncbi:3-hydroxyacyl-CoA dehydrogenase family protein [Streptomyces sp. SL13]|jgi:3-hydroxybutyryl-CoA dehydrogenase|uniref:3-hydroxyacyl-CoA dehydrogenase family protein n=1 Tax=Streptantibioticus silvisoli TaxID=2705255 RepID=A0AA90H070_9ACTN|nr:3-hydroxyacyl-CoA dehydrogenase family protein [Streptantibioticus silvisoli]MDI5968588.1 3-hydroxyacyl-CoA dehydrogenase family protein [Streptantibioticus silvisoli]